jgi:hypothetical protein
MKIIIEIPDNQASFGMKVLKSLAFIKKAQPMSAAAAQLWDDLRTSATEVKQHKDGKTKLKKAEDLLNEL